MDSWSARRLHSLSLDSVNEKGQTNGYKYPSGRDMVCKTYKSILYVLMAPD
jgi:hypothetical protein